jgi:hypothetical protein
MATNPPTPPNAPDSVAKFNTSPTFMAMLNELNVNLDQLTKRQKLIADIEQALTAKYNAPNRLMSYVMRFGHARTIMHTSDIPNIEALLKSITGTEQINLLNAPFIDEMENQMAFAKKTAVTLLNKYMLVPVHKNSATRKKNAEAIAQQLLSKELFPVHGHYINGQTAKGMGLQIDLLDREDPLWQLIWDYYMRCELQMNIPLQPPLIKTKLFESGNQVSLVSQDMP